MLDREQIADAGKWESLIPKLSSFTFKTISDFGFDRMTPVQAAVIPLFLQNKDVVVEAVTGSGKTCSFLIPIIEMLKRREEPLSKNQIGAIVLVPTRELARQISKILESFLKNYNSNLTDGILNQILIIGGKSKNEYLQEFRSNGGQIVIATPGKLEILLKEPEFNTKEMEVLVLDEADRLLDMGFEQTLRAILSHLPKQRRTGLFSATMTDGLANLVKAGLRNPVKVVVKVEDTKTKEVQRIPSTLNIKYLVCEAVEKPLKVFSLLLGALDKKCILYYNTCMAVDYFYSLFTQLPFLKSISIFALHGKMVEKKRIGVYKSFCLSKNGILICTDVAARGLDLPDIDVVIQHDPPQDPQAFLHRCGRTARYGRQGQAYLLLHPHETPYIEFMKLRKIPLEECAEDEVPNYIPTKLPFVTVPWFYLPYKKPEDDQSLITIENPSLTEFIYSLLLADRDLYLKSVTAFVSFLRSYGEHQLKYIFDIKQLNMASCLSSYFLLLKPKCPELNRSKIQVEYAQEGQRICLLDPFVNVLSEKDAKNIRFKDAKREKQRIDRGLREKEEGILKRKRREKESWSEKKQKKEQKVLRKMKKERKREAKEKNLIKVE